MNISYNWLETFFDKTSPRQSSSERRRDLPTPEKLAEILTMHCFENETLTKQGNDYILGIDVLPDRGGDCLCHLGIAKECAAILDKKLSLPKTILKENKQTQTKDLLSAEIKDKKGCKRYVARVLFDVKIKPSPKYIQERLIACGLSPINNVVDATNYIMLEMGQPLHAFDYKNIEGKKIIVRKALKNEKITTLSGLTYKLDEDTLVIADAKKPLALAGIKGGKDAEINDQTNTIVLESANFNAKLIGQTARKINLRTDASIRFEQNLDPNLAEAAINRVAGLIQEISNAKIMSGLIDVYPEKVLPKKIKLDLQNLNNILGVAIKPTEVMAILKRLDLKILKKTKTDLLIETPTSRQDLSIPENLIEEIGRVYGYEKIKPELPCGYLEPIVKNENLFWQDKTKNFLKEIGYCEAYNYSFLGEKEKSIFKLKPIKINNPVSLEFGYLRPDLMPHLLNNAKENLKTYKGFKIFELTKVFIKETNKNKEFRMLAGVIAESENSPQATFSQIRGEINLLLNKLGVIKIDFEKENQDIVWDKQNALSILINGKKIGAFGQISFNILESLEIKEKLFGFKIDFEKLQPLCSKEKTFEPISFHPPALRDISGLIDDKISVAQIKEALNVSIQKITAKDLLIIGEIVDVYKNESLVNKKSITINIKLQHLEKTLSTEEINKNIERIIKELSQNIGWEERK